MSANCCYVNGNAAIIKYNKYLLPVWFIHTILTKITSHHFRIEMQLGVQCKKQSLSVAPSWCFPPRCALRVDGAKHAHGVRMLQTRREAFPEVDPLRVLAYLDTLMVGKGVTNCFTLLTPSSNPYLPKCVCFYSIKCFWPLIFLHLHGLLKPQFCETWLCFLESSKR